MAGEVSSPFEVVETRLLEDGTIQQVTMPLVKLPREHLALITQHQEWLTTMQTGQQSIQESVSIRLDAPPTPASAPVTTPLERRSA